jgi:hypothetical protein
MVQNTSGPRDEPGPKAERVQRMNNFRFIGDLTPEKSQWWHDVERAMAEFTRKYGMRK